MNRFNLAIILAMLGALLISGCQTGVQSKTSPSSRKTSKIDFASIIAAAKKLKAAQNAVHVEGKKIQTGKEAARLANAYVESIHNFCGAADNLFKFTPALQELNEDAPELKAFFKAMEQIKLKPLPAEFDAWGAFLDRFEPDKEMLLAKSNLLAAEQLLIQWAEEFK